MVQPHHRFRASVRTNKNLLLRRTREKIVNVSPDASIFLLQSLFVEGVCLTLCQCCVGYCAQLSSKGHLSSAYSTVLWNLFSVREPPSQQESTCLWQGRQSCSVFTGLQHHVRKFIASSLHDKIVSLFSSMLRYLPVVLTQLLFNRLLACLVISSTAGWWGKERFVHILSNT